MNAKGCFVMQSAVQALLRLAFLGMVYAAVTAAQGLHAVLWLAGAVLVLVFGLMPGRFLLRHAICRVQRQTVGKQTKYGEALMLGLLRLSRGLLYGLPVTVLLSWFFISFHQMNGQDFGRMIKRFSVFLLQSPVQVTVDMGIYGFALALLLLGVYFALGWRQDMAMEYVPYPGECKAMLRKMRMLREKGEGKFWIVTFGNLGFGLLSFISILAVWAFFLGPQLAQAKGMMALLQTALRMLDEPLPAGCVWALIGVYLFICAPLCMLRKMRTAKAVREIEMRL